VAGNASPILNRCVGINDHARSVARTGVPAQPDATTGRVGASDDHKPRIWTRDQVDLLKDLATSVVTEITLRSAPNGSPADLPSGVATRAPERPPRTPAGCSTAE
jgi:hypothetical protein